MKNWMLRNNKVNVEKMAEALRISPVMAQVLANRGIGTFKSAKKFIFPNLSDMYDGYLFEDMKKGIDLINEAIDEGTKISIYGDYDVDGVMSSVILYKSIKYFTNNVTYYVPHRQKEGYGINCDSINELYGEGVRMIVCCDNGITAVEEAKLIKQLGMKFIILDHHEPAFVEAETERSDVLPDADAIIDHKRKTCTYPFKSLCAGGMSYKFSQLLFESRKAEFLHRDEALVFAAIATICDIVDLLDENRIIAKLGLEIIKNSSNIGLKALIEETGLEQIEKITEYHIGFVIGPCINATGRLESAKSAIELFLTDDVKKAKELSLELATLNNSRKNMTLKAVKECVEIAQNDESRVLVIYNENVHESIAGIVAGRIKEKFYKPTIVITSGDEMAKGSARSIDGYNIFEEMFKVKDIFHKFGGHPMAAGLSLSKESIDVLRRRLNENCKLTKEQLIQDIRLDKALNISEINMDLAKELSILAPFGKENPMPLFGTKNMFAEKITLIGKDKNIIKMSLRDKETGARIEGIDFNNYSQFVSELTDIFGEEEANQVLQGLLPLYLDLVYGISINEFFGRKTVQLIIKDFRLMGGKG